MVPETFSSLSPGAIVALVICGLLALAGFINTVGSAFERLASAWNALRAPDREQTEKINRLEAWKEQHEKDFEDYKVKIENRFEEALELIHKLELHHENDMAESREERQLIMYGLVSCLKGLESQGCNGPVPKAIEKIDKYMNEKAHRQ